MTILRELSHHLIEAPVSREILTIADELWFTGTAAEITPIRSVDRVLIGDGNPGPVTREVQQRFFDIVRNGNDPNGWLKFIP
jgi:branched-chain amino acid aminotransferase